MSNLLYRIERMERAWKRALQVAFDILLILACFVGAMALRTDGFGFLVDGSIWLALVPVVPVTIAAFIKLGLYRAVIRYITGRALRVILAGVFVSTAMLALATILFQLAIPPTVPLIYALLLFVVAGGLRFGARSLLLRRTREGRRPLLIYGAGTSGRQLVNALYQGPEYMPVAFIDDDPKMIGSEVAGLRVHGPGAIPGLIESTDARAILLAMPKINRMERRAIIARLERLPIEVKSMPGIAEIVSGRATYADVRPVSPEDLLGRDPIIPDESAMAANIAGKVVLVTGAGGTIGSELCRQIIARGPKQLILFDMAETALYDLDYELAQLQARSGRPTVPVVTVLGSVQHPGRIAMVLKAYAVQTIYHAAAYKHVPMVEENVIEGLRNNVFGTRVLAQAAADAGVESFILISTDKAVRPANVMGASKRMAELICQAQAQRSLRTVFSMVRFGNVLGSSGSVIPRFTAQIEAGGPVTVTHRRITRYFMTIVEAAQLVIQAGSMARGGDVFVLDMGEPVKILDLARTMIRLHGYEPYEIDEPPGLASAGAPPRAPRVVGPNDIGIRFVGLRKGEKLFEELLIGNDPSGTNHPRIMTAREVALTPEALDSLLDRLMAACQEFDLPAIRTLLIEAPLEFSPGPGELSDLTWQALNPRGARPPEGRPAAAEPAVRPQIEAVPQAIAPERRAPLH